SFMATPMPYAATAVAPTPSAEKRTVAAVPRPRARRLPPRKWIAIAAAGVVGVIVAGFALFSGGSKNPPSPPPPTAAVKPPQVVAPAPAPAVAPPTPAPKNHDARLKEAIHELET